VEVKDFGRKGGQGDEEKVFSAEKKVKLPLVLSTRS